MITIKIHEIALKLLSNDRPPDDLQFVAKVITSNNVTIESRPSTSTGNSWTMVVMSNLPEDSTSLDIEITGTSDSQQKDFRLQSVHWNTSDIVAQVEDEPRFSLHLDVNSVDGGFSFQLCADFSTGFIQTADNEEGLPLDDQMIASTLLSQPDDQELPPSVLSSSMFIMASYLFDHAVDPSYIEKFVSLFEEQAGMIGDDHPHKPLWLIYLGKSLSRRFKCSGDLSDLNKAVLVCEEAVGLRPDGDPLKLLFLKDLGRSLFDRVERLGDLSDINKSVAVFEEVVRLTPDGPMLNNLGISLVCRFERLGDVTDMNKSISVVEEAVGLTPDSHPGKPKMLKNLGSLLSSRFERVGDLSDIKKSVLVIEEAIRLTPDGHSDRPSGLNSLGGSLVRRFERLGDLNDLNNAVSVFEEAVGLIPDGHPLKPLVLHNLATSLSHRFDRLGHLSDLNKSVLLMKSMEGTVEQTPGDHPNKPLMLNNLGRSLYHRFQRLGDFSDMNKAVSVFEEAVRLTPDDHPNRLMWLNNFGSTLFDRFRHIGDLSDINKSVSAFEEAVGLIPDGHHLKPFVLNHLGTSLSLRFERLWDLRDLDKSILVKEEALGLTPDGHRLKPSILQNLCLSLSHRFWLLGDLSDNNKSILVAEEAVGLTPDDHPIRYACLNSLGSSLFDRFKRLGDLNDINKSVLVFEEAVGLTPDGHSDKPVWLNNLGKSLLLRFEFLSPNSDLGDIKMAEKMFEKAAMSPTGSSSIRFRACFLWATCCQLYHPSSILDPYHRAFELLPTMSWLGLPVTDRQHFLKGVGPEVDEAVSAAISAGQFETAVEWMDQGHSVIWGQLLQLRSPVNDLKQRHPEIADGFTALSKKLEGASTRDMFENDFPHIPVSVSYHDLVDKRDRLLQHIRGLEGFERFLLPRTFSELQTAARNGPVVCVNVSKCRSDALILIPGQDNILHVPLENFTHKTAEALHGHLRRLLVSHDRNISNDVDSEARTIRNDIHRNDMDAESVLERLLSQASTVRDDDRAIKFCRRSSDPETVFQGILAHLWHTVTKPVLDALGYSGKWSEDELVRVWWFTSGFLTFLPIHASGIYGEEAFQGSKLSDFVVSSYIPTLSSIITDSSATTLPNLQVLAVALPVESRLPGAGKELECIVNRVGSSNVKTLLESEATLENVVAGLKESSFVHFACHGVQDTRDPNESALLLTKSSRLTLSHLRRISLPHALLAFLSACQTATGDENLVQESVHLAAGMLSVGYRGVIATMWSIQDGDGPVVADEVYGQLFKDSEPDPTLAARALDKAVKKLIKSSSRTKSFLEWVPFIHIGI